MNYHDLVKDFARRTQKNLEFIERYKDDPGSEVYEVTQLINSLLGLIVFPEQRFYNYIPEIPLAELEREGWRCPRVRGNYPQVANLRELARYMRNAIAHSNLQFLDDRHSGSISGIILWNENRRVKDWEVELTIPELKDLTEKFINLILNYPPSQRPGRLPLFDY